MSPRWQLALRIGLAGTALSLFPTAAIMTIDVAIMGYPFAKTAGQFLPVLPIMDLLLFILAGLATADRTNETAFQKRRTKLSSRLPGLLLLPVPIYIFIKLATSETRTPSEATNATVLMIAGLVLGVLAAFLVFYPWWRRVSYAPPEEAEVTSAPSGSSSA